MIPWICSKLDALLRDVHVDDSTKSTVHHLFASSLPHSAGPLVPPQPLPIVTAPPGEMASSSAKDGKASPTYSPEATHGISVTDPVPEPLVQTPGMSRPGASSLPGATMSPVPPGGESNKLMPAPSQLMMEEEEEEDDAMKEFLGATAEDSESDMESEENLKGSQASEILPTNEFKKRESPLAHTEITPTEMENPIPLSNTTDATQMTGHPEDGGADEGQRSKSEEEKTRESSVSPMDTRALYFFGTKPQEYRDILQASKKIGTAPDKQALSRLLLTMLRALACTVSHSWMRRLG